MSQILLSPAYLPGIQFFSALKDCQGPVVIEQWAHYRKQTFFNRCTIATESGPQALSIPVVSSDNPKQYLKDVRISDHGNWRHQHWNAMASAYMNSPFFMYYADDFRPFYEKKREFLLDYNMELTNLILELAHIHAEIKLSDCYEQEPSGMTDLRGLSDPKIDIKPYQEKTYWQVFQQKTGFLPGLSAVDLLFCMGPEFKFYL